MADPVSRSRPPQVTVAVVLAVLESLVALGFGIAEIFEVRLFRAVVGVGVALLMIAFAVLLGTAARGLFRLRRWARAPVVVVQLILLPVGWSFRGGQTDGVAAAMIITALLTLVLILHPRSTRALVAEGETSAPT